MAMSSIFRMISWVGLALTILPALLVFNGQLTLEAHKGWMLLGTGLWFGGEVYRRVRRGAPGGA